MRAGSVNVILAGEDRRRDCGCGDGRRYAFNHSIAANLVSADGRVRIAAEGLRYGRAVASATPVIARVPFVYAAAGIHARRDWRTVYHVFLAPSIIIYLADVAKDAMAGPSAVRHFMALAVNRVAKLASPAMRIIVIVKRANTVLAHLAVATIAVAAALFTCIVRPHVAATTFAFLAALARVSTCPIRSAALLHAL